jgi:hypothetical protein
MIEIYQCFHQCRIISSLRRIDFMPSRNTSRVEVAEDVDIFTDGRNLAVMFVLNLGVSFAVASFVALRAYDVRRPERLSILRDVLKQIVQSPLRFLYPVEIERPDAQAAELLTLAPADQPTKDTPSLPS